MRLRREKRWIGPIVLLMVAGLLCGGYVLNKQRLESPLAERYTLKMEFTAVDAVTPGLGAPVTVAGVAVGQIDGVELKEGRGIVSASMDPAKLRHVYAGATAQLVPNTPLKDMQVRLWPGTKSGRPLEDGSTIAIRATTTPVDANELLRTMDADTRDWVTMLITDLGVGTKRRGRDLNAVLRKLGPTAAQLRSITSLMADRRAQIRRLVHNLSVVTKATANVDSDIREVVSAGDATLAVLAANELPLRRTLDRLPATLDAARTTLGRTPPFAESLERALTALDPTVSGARRTLRETPAALRGVVPLPTEELVRFVDETAPLRLDVRPASRDVAASTLPLRRSFGVLGRTSDRIARVPEDGRPYLFWLPWFAHNVNSMFASQDAHGAVVRGLVLTSCGSGNPPGELSPVLEQLLGPGSPACQEDAP